MNLRDSYTPVYITLRSEIHMESYRVFKIKKIAKHFCKIKRIKRVLLPNYIQVSCGCVGVLCKEMRTPTIFLWVWMFTNL